MDSFHHTTVVSVVHDTALNRLKVVVSFGLHTRLRHEREENVQADLELARTHLVEPHHVGLEDSLGLIPCAFAVRAHLIFLAFAFVN